MNDNEYEKKLRNGELLRLDLDSLCEYPSPSSRFDVGGLRHYLIIEKKNKEDFLDEIIKDYREVLEDLLEEMKEDEE